MRTIIEAIAYIDDQDSSDVGWAYTLTFSDGHQESGPLDSSLEDEDGAQSELCTLITAYDGPEDPTGITFHNVEKGFYHWSL